MAQTHISGIYIIKNTVNGKVYVGSAVDIPRRKKEHFVYGGRHSNLLLQRAIKKYGLRNFGFQIVEEVRDKTKLIEREQFWLDTMKSFIPQNGYNVSPTAGSTLGLQTEITKQNKILIHKFIEDNGYLPSLYSKNSDERRLGVALHAFTSPIHSSYDHSFRVSVMSFPSSQEYRVSRTKAQILQFCQENMRQPRKRATNKPEELLYHKACQYSTPKSKCYDEVFAVAYKSYPTYRVVKGTH